MTNIKYQTTTGKVVEVDVPDDVAELTVLFEREERNDKRKARWRKEKSIQAMAESGAEIADSRIEIEERRREEMDELTAAIGQLTIRQQLLIRQVYYDETPVKDIAAAEDVSLTAIYNRLEKIHKKLKKIITEGG